MEIKKEFGSIVASIQQDETRDLVDYGKCPECKTQLEKLVFSNEGNYWGREHCSKCDFIGVKGNLFSVELDPIKSYLEDLQELTKLQNQRNKLNRQIATLKKANPMTEKEAEEYWRDR